MRRALREIGEPFALAVEHAAPAGAPHALETAGVGRSHGGVVERMTSAISTGESLTSSFLQNWR